MENLMQRYDVVVVGSGPGGATVAKELAAKGKLALILEWGSGSPVSAHRLKQTWQALRWLGWPGKGLLVTKGLMAVVRGVCKGGSSTFF